MNQGGSCFGNRVTATWYQSGSRTASGAAFNPNGLTAAHRTLPFGSRVTVTNPRNGQSVTVTINDRGPFTRGVSLDLARGAARAIGMIGTQQICMS
ncbi:MAG TPA: septal ring lytic transglycosylase RlpA family protein [Xanthobacteraceae bacterium]|nr:septal ring lytic transglycosylase RlpA family protein [Xanthobacteraceae bacterium]